MQGIHTYEGNTKLRLRDKQGLYLGGIAIGVVHAGVVTLVQPLREGQKPQTTKAINQKMEGWVVGTGGARIQSMHGFTLPAI